MKKSNLHSKPDLFRSLLRAILLCGALFLGSSPQILAQLVPYDPLASAAADTTPTPVSIPLDYPTPIPTPTPTPTPAYSPAPLFLDSNYFNPLQGSLGIHFRLFSDGPTKVSVYNVVGEKVAELLNEFRTAGDYALEWTGKNAQTALVGNGVYFIILQTSSGQAIQKVILLK